MGEWVGPLKIETTKTINMAMRTKRKKRMRMMMMLMGRLVVLMLFLGVFEGLLMLGSAGSSFPSITVTRGRLEEAGCSLCDSPC